MKYQVLSSTSNGIKTRKANQHRMRNLPLCKLMTSHVLGRSVTLTINVVQGSNLDGHLFDLETRLLGFLLLWKILNVCTTCR